MPWDRLPLGPIWRRLAIGPGVRSPRNHLLYVQKENEARERSRAEVGDGGWVWT